MRATVDVAITKDGTDFIAVFDTTQLAEVRGPWGFEGSFSAYKAHWKDILHMEHPVAIAGRNVHKQLVSSCTMLLLWSAWKIFC